MNLLDLEPKYADYQIRMRRLFHTCPEASTKEFETAKLIRAELDKMGISWRECGMPTGTLATIKGARPGRTILLRGDIDGLEVTEKTGLEYASKNEGFMHACGHDCHISMLLTAGKILNDLRDRLSGRILRVIVCAIELATYAVICWYGWIWVMRSNATMQSIPWMEVRYMYAAIPVSAGFMTLYGVRDLLEALRRLHG